MSSIDEQYILPAGFRAAGLHAGIKGDAERKDMSLLVSDHDATLAGVFTLNKVKAAPVKWCANIVQQQCGRAILANSGNANACTGAQGDTDTRKMAEHTAAQLGCGPKDIAVCSTGHIGVPLPMDKILAGIDALVPALSHDDQDAPTGILTSDTGEKIAHAALQIDSQTVQLTAMAKGAGMIEPNMATMLCFVMTDAAVEGDALQSALHTATERSFNRITVDGDMSTNDTVLVLANGAAQNNPLNPDHADWPAFCEALNAALLQLALKIVDDGEGTTKVITLDVTGAASDAEADQAARKVANSLLVKTAWAGDYPVWGRIMDVLGYAGVALAEEKIDIDIGGRPVTRNGLDAGTSPQEVLAITAQKSYTIHIALGVGSGQATLYTADCTEEYVRLNMV